MPAEKNKTGMGKGGKHTINAGRTDFTSSSEKERKMQDIAVSITCYHNEEEVLAFINQLSKQSAADRIQLILTCNACEDFDDLTYNVKQIMPGARCFQPKENLGYLAGCLYGLKQSGAHYSWTMISNTDIEFTQDNFIEDAIHNVSDETWCVGPDIILAETKKHQNPFLTARPSKTRMIIWKTVFSCFPLFLLYSKMHDIKAKTAEDSQNEDADVYAVHGSCMFLRSDCIEQLIRENSQIFMYGEELLIAEIVRENGKKEFYNSKITIIHNESQSTGKIAIRNRQKWFKESIRYIDNRQKEKRHMK